MATCKSCGWYAHVEYCSGRCEGIAEGRRLERERDVVAEALHNHGMGQMDAVNRIAEWLEKEHGRDGAWYAKKIRATFGLRGDHVAGEKGKPNTCCYGFDDVHSDDCTG